MSDGKKKVCTYTRVSSTMQVDGYSLLQNLLLDGENELHNREMHVSGKFSRKQDIDPINDPINTAGLSEREKKVLDLLRQDPTLTRAKMAEVLGCSDK